MKQFDKTISVKGSTVEHVVRVWTDGFKVSAHCDCDAGKFNTLCRHVIECMTKDEDFKNALIESDLMPIYEEHIEKDKAAEKLKRESKNLKKKFARLLLVSE